MKTHYSVFFEVFKPEVNEPSSSIILNFPAVTFRKWMRTKPQERRKRCWKSRKTGSGSRKPSSRSYDRHDPSLGKVEKSFDKQETEHGFRQKRTLCNLTGGRKIAFYCSNMTGGKWNVIRYDPVYWKIGKQTLLCLFADFAYQRLSFGSRSSIGFVLFSPQFELILKRGRILFVTSMGWLKINEK